MPSIDGAYLFCPLPESTTVCISRVNAKYRMIFLMIQAKPLELQANALPTTMTTNKFASVWDAIENTPEEAENMKLRSSLMIALKSHLNKTGLTQAQAAKLFGVTAPRVSDLMRGKINLFGLDSLVNMAVAAGLHVELLVKEAA
jgi:predicted XRE-type DNA-binding protein